MNSPTYRFEFRVLGFGFRVQGSGTNLCVFSIREIHDSSLGVRQHLSLRQELPHLPFRVSRLGFRVTLKSLLWPPSLAKVQPLVLLQEPPHLPFHVSRFAFRVQGSGFRVRGLVLRVQCFGFGVGVWGFRFWVLGLGFWVLGLGFGVRGLGF